MGRPRKSEARDLTEAEVLARKLNNEAAARYRERNRETVRDKMRQWRAANREKAREQSREWRNRILNEGSPEEAAALRVAESNRMKRANAQNRKQVFAAYGGPVCNCCGESQEMFLSIDHVNNDGAQERRSGEYSSGGSAFYRWLRKKDFPDGYQVLCMNCQVGKHKNGGVCPHQTPIVCPIF